jgi:hypothetical protein
MLALENKIDRFISKLEMGLTFLADAGRALVELLDEDPSVFDDIIAIHKWVTVDMLKTVEAIGRKQLEPSTLLLPTHVLRCVAGLPIDDQINAVTKPVVVRYANSRPVEKMAKDLSRLEAKKVFCQKEERLDYDKVSEGCFELSLFNGKPFVKRVAREHGIEFPTLTLRATGATKFELIRFEKREGSTEVVN